MENNMKLRVTRGFKSACNYLGIEKAAEVLGITENGVYTRLRGETRVADSESITLHQACKGKVSKIAFMTYEN
jgi:DNA-binding transcriptional regulator YdaS (Cro superfamily)